MNSNPDEIASAIHQACTRIALSSAIARVHASPTLLDDIAMLHANRDVFHGSGARLAPEALGRLMRASQRLLGELLELERTLPRLNVILQTHLERALDDSAKVEKGRPRFYPGARRIAPGDVGVAEGSPRSDQDVGADPPRSKRGRLSGSSGSHTAL